VKLKVLIALIFSSGILYASEDTQTDIVPRVVNFLIFASIIYYLLADKIKEFFKNRKDEISAKLESVQVKVKESKKRREDSAIKVEEAKKACCRNCIYSKERGKLYL
jgi:F-type H+-transporting ATPase subunit b